MSTEPAAASKSPQVKSAEGALQKQGAFETVGLVSGVLGVTAVIFGAVLYALDPGLSPLATGNLIFGVVAVLFYAATNRKTLARAASGRSSAFVALEAVLIVGVIAGIGALNYFAAQSKKEWDLTKDGLYSLHEQSIQTAKGLKQTVTVYGFFKSSDNARGPLEQALDLYLKHTDKIALKFLNPDAADRNLMKRFKMNSKSPKIVIASESGQYTKVRIPTEESLTNALLKVTRNAQRKAYFLVGHREPSLKDEKSAEGHKLAGQLLEDEGFEVQTLSLLDKENVPKDASLVIIAGFQNALFSNEVEALRAWIDRGGDLMILLEPGTEHGMDALWRRLDVRVGDNLVLEANPSAIPAEYGPESPVIQRFEPHPITNKLKRGAAMFHYARSVEQRLGTLARVEVTTLIRTGPTSWGEADYKKGGPYSRDENDAPGPVSIAVAITKNTSTATNKMDDQARLVVVGDHHFISNKFIKIGANPLLFLNSISWLMGEENRIVIRPPKQSSDRLTLTETQQQGITFFSVNLLPLLIIGFGFSVWAVRRRK